ncbi:MAG: AsnC family transcriptional regulator [Alphaproteobacteria bacterium]|nr:AsnC family transcriptional regulator [Alphaproteobacteria bacterium]
MNRSIIGMLQQDGRRPFAELAAELDVSEGTIRNRVNGMNQAGMLRIVAIADPVAVEYQTDAMMGVKIAPGHTPGEVAERRDAGDGGRQAGAAGEEHPRRDFAFHNVCRHRCLQLVDQPKNAGKLIRCPYHAWAYDLSGKLRASPYLVVLIWISQMASRGANTDSGRSARLFGMIGYSSIWMVRPNPLRATQRP